VPAIPIGCVERKTARDSGRVSPGTHVIPGGADLARRCDPVRALPMAGILEGPAEGVNPNRAPPARHPSQRSAPTRPARGHPVTDGPPLQITCRGRVSR
jgi:hypothetical protein